eukprot:CAMPEP_0172637512 /NCGR_PEP_ID=MMETSP1068-20121228/209364_1 /TAXON_ID=35684 /ORGANISM="Pseudopedinella elastica, Strain CCMP716" /LENGTH=51 /DNA_ID=CAMNT_0013450191 /DNA_START=337 /DNA_END=488 /DNA_ORIENTATION=-
MPWSWPCAASCVANGKTSAPSSLDRAKLPPLPLRPPMGGDESCISPNALGL